MSNLYKRSHLNLLLWNRWTKLNQTWQGGSLSKLCPTSKALSFWAWCTVISTKCRWRVLLNWETETKRNETKRNTTKRNEKWRNEMKLADISRVFSSMQNEQKYPWLYDSVVHQGYLCKFCELCEWSGDRLMSPAGRRQSPGRGTRGRSPPPKLWGFEELQTFIWTTILNQPHHFYQTKKTWFWVLILSDNC
jgi:hypothetical protein